MKTNRIAFVAVLLAVAALFAGCGVDGYAAKPLAWTEDVKLPDDSVIHVKRVFIYQGWEVDGSPKWVSEEMEIPNKTNPAKPFKWTANRAMAVQAMALYFENGMPNVVAIEIGRGDELYGCSYTNYHRLFTWSENSGWRYDPYTKVDTAYVGWANLISLHHMHDVDPLIRGANFYVGTDKPHWGLPSSDSLSYIDTRHETARCDWPDARDIRYSRHSLDEILAHRKN
jgi:hypothetical protein